MDSAASMSTAMRSSLSMWSSSLTITRGSSPMMHRFLDPQESARVMRARRSSVGEANTMTVPSILTPARAFRASGPIERRSTGSRNPTLILAAAAERKNSASRPSGILDRSSSVTSRSREPEYMAMRLASMVLPSSRRMLP